VSFDGIIVSNPEHHALVLVISTHGWGPLKSKVEQRLEFGAGSTSQDVRLKTDNWLADLTGALTFVGDNLKEYWRRARKRLAPPPS
jgi:hypothetical protein